MIVSNTTPLSSLIRIDRHGLIPQLYPKIYIPEAVAEELDRGKYAVGEWRDKVVDFVEIIDNPKPSSLTRILAIEVDPGEAAAIALATERSADLLIIDDLAGRRAAQRVGLKLTGTVGLILSAAEAGLVINPFVVIEELRTRGGLWLSDTFISKLQQAYFDSKKQP